MKPTTDEERQAQAEYVEADGAFTLYSRVDMADPDPDRRDGPAEALWHGHSHGCSLPLKRVIETEVIPRLVLAQRALGTTTQEAPAPHFAAPTEGDVEAFTALARLGNTENVLTFIDAFCARGLPLSQVYLGLLAPAARILGVAWEKDTADFTEVTIGLRCLHAACHALEPRFAPLGMGNRPGRSILLAPAPGEQHGFGLLMVEQFFRRAGWETWTDGSDDGDALIAMVAEKHFGLIGFSISGETHIESLAELIRDIRRASRNADIGILVGGALILKEPLLVKRLGADATARDAEEAILQAEALLALQGRGSEGLPS
ncbi:MAG: cobalamin B12-binding domain-containing protein [Roseomonas sp.]|nr:cobalamin B12-binding domain-containing protein [Roseomonas sp.]